MITRLMVIQKICEDGQVDVFQITSDLFQWTFENNRIKLKEDQEYFPFSLVGDTRILKRRPGAETECIIKENEIIFSDDYGIPEGTVIAVLFPKSYIPDILKFKDKPAIPVGLAGLVTATSPGQFEILYNQLEKQCAIIFHIFNGTAFGFKCIAKKVSDEAFPSHRSIIHDEVFDVTLSREFLNVDIITTNDLKLINDTLNQVDLVEIQQTLNELLTSLKAGQKEESRTLLGKVGSLLVNGTSVASSLTTIADSYKTGGSAQQFVARILEYVSL